MIADEFWKNFKLNTELDIAGRFLYNGLNAFHLMEDFTREEDAFEVLYSISVGVERLVKIAIILSEYREDTDRKAFEKSLITHSHQELFRRLLKRHSINLNTVHNDFIEMLATFYKSRRYERYSVTSVTAPVRERDDLVKFLNKHLQISIDATAMFSATQNTARIRKFLGRIVSHLVSSVYRIINDEAHRLNIYTYEMEYGSKASKIFTLKEFDFHNEDILQAELLAYFMSERAIGPNSKLLKDNNEALPFEPAEEQGYILALRSDKQKLMVLDELNSLYDEHVNDVVGRHTLMNASYLSLDSYCDGDEE